MSQIPLCTVTYLNNWYRIPNRYQENKGDQSRALRLYQLGLEEYRFLQRMQIRFGGRLAPAAIALESFLCGAVDSLRVSTQERAIINETAREMRLVFPRDI